jgi:phosphatidate cytidylyltransferase
MFKSFWKLSELSQRVITAIAGGLLILFSVLLGHWGYFGVFLLICVITLVEFYSLLGVSGEKPLATFGTLVAIAIYSAAFLYLTGNADGDVFYVIFFLLSFIFLIKLYNPEDKHPFRNIANTILGIVYVGIPFSLMHFLVIFEGDYHPEILLGILFILWASDTGAYFSGKMFGKNKLFERISPKKTWEGSIGGAFLATFVASAVAFFSNIFDIYEWLSIAAVVVIAGTYGDLVESLFKRSIKIKDSGKILPGHGGFLDRFDGLLLIVPFVLTLVKMVFPIIYRLANS